jgi:Tfp pilus assembly protein PilN
MRYTVIGRHRQTGREVSINLDAPSDDVAQQQAIASGIAVSRVYPAPVKPVPVIPYSTGAPNPSRSISALAVFGGVLVMAIIVGLVAIHQMRRAREAAKLGQQMQQLLNQQQQLINTQVQQSGQQMLEGRRLIELQQKRMGWEVGDDELLTRLEPSSEHAGEYGTTTDDQPD